MRWHEKLKPAVIDFVNDFYRHEIFNLSSSLAYTLALTLSPFLVIILVILQNFGSNFQNQLVVQAKNLLGSEAGQMIEIVIQNSTAHADVSGLAGIVSFLIVILAASAIFTQLRRGLDRLTDYQPAMDTFSIKKTILERFVLSGLLVGFVFLLIVSLVVNATLAHLPTAREGPFWLVVTQTMAYGLMFLLFTLIFRFVPSLRFSWRYCLVAGGISSLFFEIGRFLIGAYLGRSAVGSAYGAAGSLVVLLVWIYYNALTFFVSFEFTNSFIFRKLSSGLKLQPGPPLPSRPQG